MTCERQKSLSKMDIQTKLYVTQIFDNDLVAIGKNKFTLTLKKTYIHWNVYFGIN